MRTVGVQLVAEMSEFNSELDKGASKTRELDRALQETAVTGSVTEKALASVGNEMSDAARAAEKLDRQIKDVKDSLRELAIQSALTGDVDIAKKMRTQQSELRKLMSARKLLPDITPDDEKAGTSWGLRLGKKMAEGAVEGLQSIGTLFGRMGTGLPPQAQAAIGAGILAAATVVLPLIGGVIAGAVVGGIGIGGVVGGIMVAAKHPDVQAAGKLTGEQFTSSMQQGFAPFVPAVISSLSDVRAAIRNMGGDFDRIGASAARFLQPLTQGALGLIQNLLPGIEDAINRAGPVIDELASWGPRLGTLLSDIFTEFSAHAAEGAAALNMLWSIMEYGIRSIAVTIDGLAQVYGWLDKLGAIVTGDVQHFMELSAAQQSTKNAHDATVPSLQEVIRGFQAEGDKAATAATQVQSLTDQIKANYQANLDARGATRSLEAAIDDGTAALKKNGKTLDENTPKGRANGAALDAIAAAANKAGEAVLKGSGDQAAANAEATRGRDAFIALAVKMGMSREAAIALANKLIAIPSPKPTITVQNQQAIDAIAAVQSDVNNLHGKNITVGVYYTTKGDLKLPGGTSLKGAASGGPVDGPGPKGIDSQPYMLAPGEHILTASEVDRMGGQGAVSAFRAGLMSGRQYMTLPSVGASSAPVNVTNTFTINAAPGQSPRQIAEEVSRIIGRESGIYARAGGF